MRKGTAKAPSKQFNMSGSVQPSRCRPAISGAHAFSFGEPEQVLGGDIGDYLGLFIDPLQDYYTPPVSLKGLAKISRISPHHGTIPYYKRNRLCQFFNETKTVTSSDLGRAGIDFLIFGNCYFKKIFNGLGQVVRLVHIPALNVRRMREHNRYCMLRPGKDLIKFQPNEVIHLLEYDVNQQIYGLPQYMGAINSILLNSESKQFRLKYFRNGAHMGFVFYTADARLSEEDEEALKNEISQSKGVGNFRSLFLNIPGGKPDSVKILPVGDIATKDEFERIQNITRDDAISVWRIQPALAGVMATNAGGHGDITKISKVYHDNETVPFQNVLLHVNDHLPKSRHISFSNQNVE